MSFSSGVRNLEDGCGVTMSDEDVEDYNSDYGSYDKRLPGLEI